MSESIDPVAWLEARGWTRYTNKCGLYWRQTPNEYGWEGGWNTVGAVHVELEKDNRELLKRMGLYKPPTRRTPR
jgi:hypothetical protein